MEQRMQLTHIDEHERPRMVDVSGKGIVQRMAKAEGFIELAAETVALIAGSRITKGNVLVTAELAGVQAGKQTANLIPLCHTLQLTKV